MSTAAAQAGGIDEEQWSRLRILRNPLRMPFTSGVWAAAWYLFSSMVVGTVLFALIVSVTAVSVGLAVVWAGLPMLIGTAYFIRGCVLFERGRAWSVVPEGLPALEPMENADGFFGILKSRWRDRVTLRGLAHFTILWVPLMVLDTVVFTVWLALLGYSTVPIWYRYVPTDFPDGSTAHGLQWGYFPHGPHGPGSWGFFIGSEQAAIVAAVVCLVMFLAWNYVLVAAARLHVSAVRSIFADRDPLADVRRVLNAPGPLGANAG